MYYSECTAAYKVAFIKDIIEYASSDYVALELIQSFIDGTKTTSEISDMLSI